MNINFMTKREYVQAMQWQGNREDFPKFEAFASRAGGGFTKLTIDADGWLRPWWGEKKTHGCAIGEWLVLRQVETEIIGMEFYVSLEVMQDHVFKKRYEVADKKITLETPGMTHDAFIGKWGSFCGDDMGEEGLSKVSKVYWMALYEVEQIPGEEGKSKLIEMSRDFLGLQPKITTGSSYWHAKGIILNQKR